MKIYPHRLLKKLNILNNVKNTDVTPKSVAWWNFDMLFKKVLLINSERNHIELPLIVMWRVLLKFDQFTHPKKYMFGAKCTTSTQSLCWLPIFSVCSIRSKLSFLQLNFMFFEFFFASTKILTFRLIYSSICIK